MEPCRGRSSPRPARPRCPDYKQELTLDPGGIGKLAYVREQKRNMFRAALPRRSVRRRSLPPPRHRLRRPRTTRTERPAGPAGRPPDQLGRHHGRHRARLRGIPVPGVRELMNPHAPHGQLATAEWVISRLEEAGTTLLAMPNTGPSTRLVQSGLEWVRDVAES